MIEDCILVNLETVEDGDRLTLIKSSDLESYLTSLKSKLVFEQATQLQLSLENQEILKTLQAQR